MTSSLKRQKYAFFIVAGLILSAAVALNATVMHLKLTFRKLPVDPQQPLKTLPAVLGPWQQASIDEALSADLEHELGATQYVMRIYVDTRLLNSQEARDLKNAKSKQDYGQVLMSVRRRVPQAMLMFQMTYYTGLVDTVAHVPDRCFLADGYMSEASVGETWKCNSLGMLNPDGGPTTAPVVVVEDKSEKIADFPMQYITFRNTLPGREGEVVQVAYSFNCNGAWSNDSIQGVRIPLQNLFEKYGYYSKLELRIDHPNRDDSRKAMQDFMIHATPALREVLPDWAKIKTGQSK